MKDTYFYSVYANMFSPLLVIITFYAKYFTIKRVWWQIADSTHLQIGVKWFRITLVDKQQIREDRCCSLILALSIFSLLATIANRIYFSTGHQGNVINNSYYLVEFLLLSAFYHYLHEKETAFRKRKIAWIGVGVYLFFFLSNLYTAGSIQEYLIQPRLVSTVIFMLYAQYTFIRLRGGPLVNDKEMSVMNEKMYNRIVKMISASTWFNYGIVIYFTGSFLISAIEALDVTAPRLFTDKSMVEKLYIIWGLHNILHAIKNICFCRAIYVAHKYGMIRRIKIPPAKYVPIMAN